MSDLRDLPADADTVFGGKAGGLMRLIAAGTKVPAGFSVEATTTPPGQWSEPDREAFLRRAKDLLKHGPLVVRSSAVGEDSAARSFAGLFETVLGVNTPDEALAAAGHCIASGGAARVLEYAGAKSPLAVGLVVQSMVEAAAAGVCFTQDPSGKDGAVVIEAVSATGDRLVSGAATPERWRAYRSAPETWECRSENSGGILTIGIVSEIASNGSTLAEYFGYPLDLEWALDGAGTVWWLQARPITAGVTPSRYVIQRSFDGVDDGPVTIWSNWNVQETLPDPMFPLTWTVWRDVVIPMVTNQLFGIPRSSPLMPHMQGVDLVHGRVYINMNCFLAVPLFGPLVMRILAAMDPLTGDMMRELTSTGVLRPRRLPGSRARILLGILGASLMSAIRFTDGLRPRRALKMLKKMGAEILRRRPVSELSNEELIDEMQLFLQPVCSRLRRGIQLEVMAIGIYGLALRAFKPYPTAQGFLATGIPANPTTQISLCIDELAETARPLADTFLEPLSTAELLKKLETTSGGLDWLAQFHEFLEAFGHRGPMEFDMGAVRWAEDPTMIINLIREHLRAAPGEGVRSRMSRLTHERQQAISEAVAAAPFWRRPFLRGLARLVELYMPLREAPKHYGVLVFHRMRQAALELGHRLSNDGIIHSPDDVFFLEWPELCELIKGRPPAANLHDMLVERKQQLERFRKEQAPGFFRSDGIPVSQDSTQEEPSDGVLRGTGVSAGHAAGPVRILSEPDPLAMREGDVIVMEFADPGWTPLFPRATAIIMEVGGLMCHAAVVAREMGIPAVFGVPDATRILTNGQHVTVDGSRGTVTAKKEHQEVDA